MPGYSRISVFLFLPLRCFFSEVPPVSGDGGGVNEEAIIWDMTHVMASPSPPAFVLWYGVCVCYGSV